MSSRHCPFQVGDTGLIRHYPYRVTGIGNDNGRHILTLMLLDIERSRCKHVFEDAWGPCVLCGWELP